MLPDTFDIIDISPMIEAESAVFPGDTPFKRKVQMDFSRGDNLLLSSFESTAHIGAHTDGPNHYHKDGDGIDRRSLRYYIGLCQIIRVNIKRGQRIYPRDIEGKEIKAPRILFRTDSFPDQSRFNKDFNSLSPELVEHLAGQGVLLVGLDTPSVDPWDSKALESHNAIYKNDMAILEGVVLDHADDGLYTLIALPLKIKDGDASPVRAVLLK